MGNWTVFGEADCASYLIPSGFHTIVYTRPRIRQSLWHKEEIGWTQYANCHNPKLAWIACESKMYPLDVNVLQLHRHITNIHQCRPAKVHQDSHESENERRNWFTSSIKSRKTFQVRSSSLVPISTKLSNQMRSSHVQHRINSSHAKTFEARDVLHWKSHRSSDHKSTLGSCPAESPTCMQSLHK